MLEILYGPAGSGKTDRIFAAADEAARAEKPVLLLVPEQFSFENERALLTRFGPQRAARIRVLSFSRLAELVLRATGGSSRAPLDEMSALLFAGEALRQSQDRLDTLQCYARSAETAAPVLAAIRECKRCADNTIALAEAIRQLSEGPLQKKMLDLLTVVETYDALIEKADRIDAEDLLSLCAERLPEAGLADGAQILVDSFKGFTCRETAVLRALLTRAGQVTVTLCTDTLSAAPGDRFFGPCETARQLQRLAQQADIPCRAVCLPGRSGDTVTDVLARDALSGRETPCAQGVSDRVTLRRCRDRREQAEQAARFLHQYLRKTGRRARACTVVVRQLGPWEGLLDAALDKAGLPYYMDRRSPVLTEPLIATVLAALRFAGGTTDTEELLRLAKLGLVCEEEAARQLEQYVFVWSIRAGQWLKPFTGHPDGFAAMGNRVTEESAARLEAAEQTRRRLIGPLLDLKNALCGPMTGVAFATAVTDYLRRTEVPQALEKLTLHLRQTGEPMLADRVGRTWTLCMDLLGRIADVFAQTEVPAARLIEAFRALAAAADLGSLPPSVDAIQIGQADRIRYQSPELVLLLGANEREFPAAPAAGGLLTDTDRLQLADAGLHFQTDLLAQVSEEAFFAYAACCAAHDHLYISCAERDREGALATSALWNSVCALLPRQPVCTDPLPPETAADLFAELADGAMPPVQAASYRELLRERDDFSAPLAALERACARDFAYTNRESAPELYASDWTVSASQVEKFYQCPFAYFCRYGLHIRAPRPAGIDASLIGTLTHTVLQELLKSYGSKNFEVSREEIRRDVNARTDAFVAKELPLDAVRMHWQVRQVARLCSALLWRLTQELKDSAFKPIAYELPIGRKELGSAPAWVLPLDETHAISLNGYIDRVDRYVAPDAQAYLRIVDYKTSAGKKFSLRDVADGLDLQMLLYLFALCGPGGKFEGDIPAGVLYVPGAIPTVSADKSDEREWMKKLRASGMLLQDASVVQAMEAMPGTFVPAKLKTNGEFYASSSTATQEQFGWLRTYVTQLLREMATDLLAGEIPAEPAKQGQFCQYCDYAAVCGRRAAEDEEEEAAPEQDPWDKIRRTAEEVAP